MDLVSQRRAVQMLAEIGLTPRHARRALAGGLAGEPVATAGALLYTADAVRTLVARTHVDARRLDEVCPQGYFIARRHGIEPTDPDTMSGGWDIAWIGVAWMQLHVARHGPMPLIATIAGFVAGGADITDVDLDEDGRACFELSEAGPWFGSVSQTRFPTGRGRDYVLRLPGWAPRPLTTP
jgi:hypothetical protein